MSDLYCDGSARANGTNPASGQPLRSNGSDDLACAVVREWAEKLLGTHFNGMSQLADYLVDKLYVDQRGRTASQWNKQRTTPLPDDADVSTSQDAKGVEQDHMRELKRK